MTTLRPDRHHRAVAKGDLGRLRDVLDEIHDDHFAGRITKEQRLREELGAHLDCGLAREKRLQLESN